MVYIMYVQWHWNKKNQSLKKTTYCHAFEFSMLENNVETLIYFQNQLWHHSSVATIEGVVLNQITIIISVVDLKSPISVC